MAYEWSKDEKTMHCDKTWGFAELPAFKNRTINELEGFNIDQ